MRLRSFRGESILTFKGAPEPGPHKSRAEYETSVADAGILAQVLVQLGFGVVFRYEKYRTTYARGEEPGHAVLDETPIGVFLELEGAPDWIDATARAMGFNHEDYILESYGSLYRAWCERRGVEPAHMVFAEAAGEGTLE